MRSCRSAKRNYTCTPIDPTDPSSKCTKCEDRKILDKCTGLHWPRAKTEKLRNAELRATKQSEITQLSNRVDALQDKLGIVDELVAKFGKLEEEAARLTKMIRNIVSSKARDLKFK